MSAEASARAEGPRRLLVARLLAPREQGAAGGAAGGGGRRAAAGGHREEPFGGDPSIRALEVLRGGARCTSRLLATPRLGTRCSLFSLQNGFLVRTSTYVIMCCILLSSAVPNSLPSHSIAPRCNQGRAAVYKLYSTYNLQPDMLPEAKKARALIDPHAVETNTHHGLISDMA